MKKHKNNFKMDDIRKGILKKNQKNYEMYDIRKEIWEESHTQNIRRTMNTKERANALNVLNINRKLLETWNRWRITEC